jgi:alginate O-acetyltransferase complex protein AlgI
VLFNSLPFLLIFLPIVLGIARSVRGRFLLFWIAGASCVFYAFAGHAWFLVPMAVTTVLDYLVGFRLAATQGRKKTAYLLLSLCGNLGLLAYFKYSGLIVATVDGAVRTFGLAQGSPWTEALRVTLPAGISFYTFQTLSYVLDIYRGHAKPERSFTSYLAFVAFFPHLVAGPLTRHNQLIPQLHEIARRGIRARFWPGVSLFSIGLVKKVLIADRIGTLIDPMIADVRHLGFAPAWLVLVGYAMQLYFDFSGYSDMAIGLGRLFEIELPQNFNSPYKALDPSDFWRRWHITLSQWLRDYLYISLGGNRKGAARTQLNLMVTMGLGGLWHGANWTFAIWGIYHGLLLVLHRHLGQRWAKMPAAVQRGLMFILVCIGWVFFRAPSLGAAGAWLSAMVGRQGLFVARPYVDRVAFLVVIATSIAMVAPNAYELDFGAMPRWRRAALGLVTAAAVVMMNYSSKFLYFQF